MDRNLTGTLLVLFSAGGYAFFSIFTKMAESAGVTAFDLAVWRFVVASAIFWVSYPLWRKRSGFGALTRRDVLTMLLLGVMLTVSALTAFIGLATPISVSTYTLLANTYPAMVAVISYGLGERQPAMAWLAVALAIFGCFLVLNSELRADNVNYLVWPLVNGLSTAIYMVTAQRTTRHIPGLTSGIFVITGACLTLLAIGLVRGIAVPPSLDAWLPVLGIAFFSTVIGVAALLAGIRYVGASRAALIAAAGPPTTLLLAALIFAERLAFVQYLGGALVLASVILVNLSGRRRENPIEPGIS